MINWKAHRIRRDRSLAAKLLELPAVWAETLVGAFAGLAGRLPGLGGPRAAQARGGALEGRPAAARAFAAMADDLDRLGGKVSRLSRAAARDMTPRRRGWFARMTRAPTRGEAVAEGARHARRAGFNLVADVAAPLFSLWLAGKTRGAQAVDWAARQGRNGADPALDRPTGWRAWFARPSARRVERATANAAAAKAQAAAQAAAALDEMKDKYAATLRAARRFGDTQAARSAREGLERVSRLRLTLTEAPPPPGVLDTLLQGLGAAPIQPPRVRASMALSGGREARKSALGMAAAALAAVATYATLQAVLSRRSGAGFAEEDRHEGSGFASASRAVEPGRGRAAERPREIPTAGWKDILWRTWDQIGQDRLLAISAGVVFYGLLALSPAITALVSSYGLFASPATIGEHLGFLRSALPPGAYDIVSEQIQRVAAAGDAKLGLSFLFGLALALWSANAGVKAVIDALNIVYDEKETRGFFKLNAISLAFTMGAVAAALIGVGAIVVLPVAINAVGLGQSGSTADLVAILRWPLLTAMVMLGLALLYRYGPSRRAAKWRWLSVGTIAATALWIAGSLGLSFYVANFGDYDKTYGSLGAVIGMMMWMWLSAIVVLFGAELNSEIEHQTARDTTEGAAKPLGARGARMADTVGAAAG